MPFPKFEDWKSPWDKSGETFDAERARKYVYDVQKERSDTNDELTTAKQTVATLTAEKSGLETKVATLEKDGGDTAALKSQIADLQTKLDQAAEQSRAAMLAAVKEEFGLTDKQAAKLDGDDLEALRTDARETFGDPVAEEAGGDGEDDEEESDDDKEEETPPTPAPVKRTAPPVSAPRRRVKNGGDPTPNQPKRATAEEVLAKIPLTV